MRISDWSSDVCSSDLLILDLLEGDPTLFVRADEVEAAWAWIDSIHHGWAAADMKPVKYAAGNWGPSSAIALIERDGASWHDRSEEHTSELQSLMRNSYAVFCLNKKNNTNLNTH